MTLQMVYLRNVTNKINLTELMINPETIEFMGINILFLFPLFFSFNPKKKKKVKKNVKKKKIKMQTRTFTIAFFLTMIRIRKIRQKGGKGWKNKFLKS